jgi:hypothetical protein
MGWIDYSLWSVMKLKIGYSPNRVGNTATTEIQAKPSCVSIVVKSCGEGVRLNELGSTKAGGK